MTHTFSTTVDRSNPPSRRYRSTCMDCMSGTGWTTKAGAHRFEDNHDCDVVAASGAYLRSVG